MLSPFSTLKKGTALAHFFSFFWGFELGVWMGVTLCALVLVRRSLIGSEMDSLRRPSKRDLFDFFCDMMLLLLLLLLMLPLEIDNGAGDEGFDRTDVNDPDEA